MRVMLTGLTALAGLAITTASATVWAEAPDTAAGAAAYCRRVGDDDRPMPMPKSLMPSFERAFGFPVADSTEPGYIRCAGGRVLGCLVGANLPCGPADTRHDIPAADAWCRDNGDPDVIPAAVTGHATVYEWHCQGGRALPTRQLDAVDPRGFIGRYWRPLGE